MAFESKTIFQINTIRQHLHRRKREFSQSLALNKSSSNAAPMAGHGNNTNQPEKKWIANGNYNHRFDDGNNEDVVRQIPGESR